MEIDLGAEIVIKVKVGTQVYELREPTFNDIELISDLEKEDVKKANKAMQDFIVQLGMPREVVSSLGVLKLKKLAEGITGSFSEGK